MRRAKKQKEAAEFIIKPRLEQLEGVSRVEIRGGDDEEISVEIDPEKASSLNITLSEIAQASSSITSRPKRLTTRSMVGYLELIVAVSLREMRPCLTERDSYCGGCNVPTAN